MIVILMASHTVYNSNVRWEEFVGIFESVEQTQAATDEDRASWYQAHREPNLHNSAPAQWLTNDFAIGGGVRRSFYLIELPLNSTVVISGDESLTGLK